MSERFATRLDVAAKVEWEGGLEESLHYGLDSGDMPEDDDELIDAWRELTLSWDLFQLKAKVVRSLLPDPYE